MLGQQVGVRCCVGLTTRLCCKFKLSLVVTLSRDAHQPDVPDWVPDWDKSYTNYVLPLFTSLHSS